MSVRAMTERNAYLTLREKSLYAPLASAAARQSIAHSQAKLCFAFLTALAVNFNK